MNAPENLTAAAPEVVWVNGREAAAVSVLDRGLHYGDGLFETIACLEGRPRFLGLHLERLAAGCARLKLPAPPAALREEVLRLAHDAPRAVIKVMVTRGAAQARGYRIAGTEAPTRIALRYAWPPEDPRLAEEGVRVRLATQRLGENPALAGLKHLNRLEQVLAQAEEQEASIAEAVMFSSSGALISGTMSNVFLVRDGRLCTPRVDRCGVAGIMRQVVRALAAQQGLGGEECELRARDLENAPEVFLTNALIGIRPVRELAGRALQPGWMTRTLQSSLAPRLRAGGELSAAPDHG